MSAALKKDDLVPSRSALGFEPSQVLRICGMRRSGNHAIANWLQRNSPSGEAVFLNNCKPGTNPVSSFRGFERNGKRTSPGTKASGLSGIQDGALFLFSYEDTSTAEHGPSRPLTSGLDNRLITRDVVIYRSFLNWAASLLKKMQRNPTLTASRRAGILMRAIDPYVRCLQLVQSGTGANPFAICYDDWTAESEYREAVLAELGLPVKDNDLGPVQKYGGGSSFQPDAKSPDLLQTQNRADQMMSDAEFQAILHLVARDSNLTDCLKKVFPEDAERLLIITRQMPIGREAQT